MISTTGRNPVAAAPTAAPQNPISEIGVSRTRAAPYLSSRPSEVLNGPSATATSSPIRITVGSAAMASSRARAIDWRMRSFTPETLPSR